MVNKRACKGCIFYTGYYGNKTRDGKPNMSKHWCVKKQCFIKRFPKECEHKKTEVGFYNARKVE